MKILKSVEDIWLSAMKASATTLSALIGKDVTVSNIEKRSVNKIGIDIVGIPYLVIKSEFQDLTKIFLLFDENTVLLIASLMMGEETPVTEFNEITLSAATEAFSQMLGTVALSLSEVLGKRIQVKPPEIYHLDDNAREEIFREELVGFRYNLNISGSPTVNIYQIVEVASEDKLIPKVNANDAKGSDIKEEKTGSSQAVIPGESASVQPVTFQPLTVSQGREGEKPIGNLELLKDVPIQVSVELGRTKMYIKDILALSPGSIVELEKLAGEPVDILANGKLIAKGEVVVIDESFGVRITEILNPEKKMEEE